MSKEVQDATILAELARLTEYYERVVKPVQEKRLADALKAHTEAQHTEAQHTEAQHTEALKAHTVKDGQQRAPALCDNGEPALRSVDSVHLSV